MSEESLPDAPREGKDDPASSQEKTGKIRFHYIKSNHFRVIHSDGVYGGITPSLGLQLAFFSQRMPIPQQMVHAYDPDRHSLGDELPDERVSRDGIVREVEVNVLMDLEEGKKLVGWLAQKVVELEELRKSAGVLESGSRIQIELAKREPES